MMPRATMKQPLAAPALRGTGLARLSLLGVAAPFGTAALVHAGLAPLSGALLSAGVFGLLGWLGQRSARRRLETTLGELARDVEAGRASAEQREQLLQSVLEATPLALVFYSDVGQILYANAEARRLFFDDSSPVGQNFLRLTTRAPETLRRALLGDSDELFSMDVEGQSETYHVSRRVFDFDGQAHTLLLVRQLTREVSRREVEVLKKVIRVISHELNNSLAPVASLIHSARLIAKNPAQLSKLERVFDTIEERAQHLTAFLAGYAELAHLPKPRAQRIEWPAFLEHLAALFPDVKLPAPPAAGGYFDQAQIEQVLINLFKNAIEAGGHEADVELAIVVEGDGSLTFEVSDRGHGLSQEALESAFLPLYSTKGRGSGLGLALCREVIVAHGGRASIKNRDGGGCTVKCWLPGPPRPNGADTSSRARLTLTHS
jgi:two-component system, NtrC family, nitrogen regulation sensor histidine kinase NtrY